MTALNQSSETLHGPALNGLFGYAFTVPGSDPTELGVPNLRWSVDAANGAPGWVLTVQGMVDQRGQTVIVGVVAEQDEAGVAEMASLMADRDALFAYASFNHKFSVDKIIAELRTRDLVNSSVPRPINSVIKVRSVLTAAGLAPSADAPSNSVNVGHINALYIREGSAKVAVAVAVTAPTQLSKTNNTVGVTYYSKEAIAAWVTETADWRARAEAALTAEGYRIVDLPQPITNKVWLPQIPVVWATLYNASEWEEARPAAEGLARVLAAHKGPLITPAADRKR